MKRPHEVHLSREAGEALRQRLDRNALTAEDRRMLGHILEWYFWLVFTVQEAKLSLKRLRTLLFGAPRKQRKGPPPDRSAGARSHDEELLPGEAASAPDPRAPQAGAPRRPGHGRQSAQAYVGATQVVCHHETLRVGEHCPVCGRGRLYRVPPGVMIRLTGNALVSAVHYALEKLRCSACGQVFTAGARDAGAEKYTASARAALVVSRDYLGVPMYRLAGYQAMVGVPISDATQWEQIERVADCAYPVFAVLQRLAAQGDVIYQDDTHVRILSLIAENRRAMSDGDTVPDRPGMHTTGLIATQGRQTIVLYFCGRAHAGENLATLVPQRQATQVPLIVMSDALAANTTVGDNGGLIRCYCLAHGHRKFRELADVFPAECAVVIAALQQVFDHEAVTQTRHMAPLERLAYHQQYSGPLMAALKDWLDTQFATRAVEPNSSLGKAIRYLQTRWQGLTQFLRVPNAPLDNNTAERALKLAIRQRKNSLFYATEHGAYVGSLLMSLIATCLHTGSNALAYLVALQEHRSAVFREPAAWLPWNYQATLAPP
jgi:transposase